MSSHINNDAEIDVEILARKAKKFNAMLEEQMPPSSLEKHRRAVKMRACGEEHNLMQSCKKCAAIFKLEDTSQQQKKEKAKIAMQEKMAVRSMEAIMPKYANATFNNYNLDGKPEVASLLNAMKHAGFNIKSGYIFYGDYGRGKTMLAALILKQYFYNGTAKYMGGKNYPQFYMQAEELVRYLTAGDGQGNMFYQHLKTAPILIIDEFEKCHNRTEYLDSQLMAIFNHRLDLQKQPMPTILITNKTASCLVQKNKALLCDRYKYFKSVPFKGKNLRKQVGGNL